MSLSASIHLELDDFVLNIDLNFEKRILALIGPNGCGKSTLLTTLVGAHRPNEGFIRLNKESWFDSITHTFVKPEHRNIAYLPQSLALFPHLTALDNVVFSLSSSTPQKKKRERAHHLLEELSCTHLASKYPRELSGGEAQRIAIARTLILSPCLWLFDEPFSAIDPSSKEELRSIVLQRISASGAPAIVVTHSPDDIKAFEAQIGIMSSGTIVQHGSFDEVSKNPQSGFATHMSLL